MEEAQAIEVALDYGSQRGYDVSRYTASAKKVGREWTVHFHPGAQIAKPAPGDFFTVTVDDESGIARDIFPGK